MAIPTSETHQISNNNTQALLKVALPVIGRALTANPTDNLAKRLQVYPGNFDAKAVSTLLFQGAKGIQKIPAMYKGMAFGLGYKGLQTMAFDSTFGLKETLEKKTGSSPVNDFLIGVGMGGAQTAVLHPASTIRTRLSVNNKDLLKVTDPKVPEYLKSSSLFGAVYQGNFGQGLAANFLRNLTFLSTSGAVYPHILKYIQDHHILGGADKPNENQTSSAKVLSGCVGVTSSVFFDNVKTLKQTSEQTKTSTLTLIKDSIKEKGLGRTMRPSVPYIISEALGLVGFYAGKRLANKIVERLDGSVKNQAR